MSVVMCSHTLAHTFTHSHALIWAHDEYTGVGSCKTVINSFRLCATWFFQLSVASNDNGLVGYTTAVQAHAYKPHRHTHTGTQQNPNIAHILWHTRIVKRTVHSAYFVLRIITQPNAESVRHTCLEIVLKACRTRIPRMIRVLFFVCSAAAIDLYCCVVVIALYNSLCDNRNTVICVHVAYTLRRRVQHRESDNYYCCVPVGSITHSPIFFSSIFLDSRKFN